MDRSAEQTGDPLDRGDDPYVDYFQEGCAAMAWYSCNLLKLAGHPVTIANILKVVNSTPFRVAYLDTEAWKCSYCKKLLDDAHTLAFGCPISEKLKNEIYEFFILRHTQRSKNGHRMLEAAFGGILNAIDWDAIVSEPGPVVPRSRRVWNIPLIGRVTVEWGP